MTTFQAIIYAAIHGITQFLPLGPKAHHILFPYIIGWQAPSDAFLGALSLGAVLALLIYFRHDLASMISSVLQVIIYRKRPMTLDERLPLFIGITTIPTAVVSYYFSNPLNSSQWTPILTAGVLAAVGIPLWLFDYLSRKTKAIYDWNWGQALVVGLIQATAILPGWDHLSALLIGALFLNYRREAAAKYAYFALTPVLLTQTFNSLKEIDFHAAVPMLDLSWFSFIVATVITLLVGLLTIGGFMKHVQQKGLKQYLVYRWALAIGVCVLYWYRSQS